MKSATSPRLSVETELSNLAAELIEVFSSVDDQLDSRQLLKNYIRHVTRCGLAAGRCGSPQLQDHCVQFQGMLRSLQEQPAEVVSRYQGVLEQWPLLLMSHLNSGEDSPFLNELEDLLAHTTWPTEDAAPESHPEAEVLPLAQDIHIDTPVEDTAVSDQGVLLEEFTTALAPLAAMQDNGEDADIAQLQTAFADSADALELFAISAGHLGMLDIGQLFSSSLRQWQAQAVADPNVWHIIAELRSAVAAYLESPNNPANIAPLLSATKQLPAASTLSDSDLANLAALFGEEEIELTAQAMTPVEDVIPAQDEIEIIDNVIATENVRDEPETENDNVDELVAAIEAEPLINAEIETNDNDGASSDASPETDIDAQPVTLTPQALELLQLIAAEFEQVTADLAEHLQVLTDTDSQAEAYQEANFAYTSALERFSSVFESLGLNGMAMQCNSIRQFLSTRGKQDALSIEQQFWLAEWPAHVLNYLTDPLSNADALITHCLAEDSVLGLDGEAATQCANDLRHPRIDTGEEDKAPRQTVAEASDISLQLPDDVNQQLLDSLLQELPNQTAEFSRVIANIVQSKGNLQDLETAQRVAHTLKGAANTVGVAGIANLTHHMEDILLAFTRQKVLPAPPLTNTLQDAADVLEMMSEALLGMGTVPTQQAQTVLQQILDWANQIDLNGLPEASEYIAAAPAPAEAEDEAAAASTANSDTSLRVSTQSVDETLRLIGESIIVNAQLEEGLRHSITQNHAIHAQSSLFQQLAFELEQLIDVRGMNTFFGGVTNSDFDALEMDQYNELHTLTRRMVEAATDARAMTQTAEDDLKNLDTLIHQQKRHHKDIQDVVMKTRMLPVQNIVPRLQRSVRQTCRLTGKDADLNISGNQTLIDNDILNNLADPLMHVLRNAVDHGIEAASVREAKGKPARGQISLAFSREGEHIMIRCRDDGAGLDYNAIRRVALAKGLLEEDSELTQDELTRLIFVSGLTTREETTQMSGRGIGMDAVYTQIVKMKGTIRVSSDADTGTLIEMQLPATLVTLHGILTLTGDQVLAISNRGVEQILYADAGELSQNGKQLFYHYKDERYTAYFIEDLIGSSRSEQSLEDLKRPAMLLNLGDGGKAAVLVEKIIATQDVVIKRLGQYVPPLSGVEGVTILGDGSVASVLDLSILVASFQGSDYIPKIEHSDLDGIQSGAPKVLVVDDSLSARTSLAEFMQDSGYRVFTARDGMDAITQLDEHLPDILLVDMEMPRMNGLELTAFVRANPATQNLPIIMITSRATDKHRREADKAGVNAYLIKPYSEVEVLDQVESQLASAFSIKQHNVHQVNGVNV
ncbi:MAG: response regulator [Gammaproteobacteria bacterium]|nr:response regulator [Gammaproteobacteria bacterium]